MKRTRQMTEIEFERLDNRFQIKRKGNVITRFIMIPKEPIASKQSDTITFDLVVTVNGAAIPFDLYMEDIYLQESWTDQ